MDRACKQQQLFGERGFTRIGVRNDGESAAPGNFLVDTHVWPGQAFARDAANAVRRAL
jgi:hypothetical protein